jgi:hypothetical protein
MIGDRDVHDIRAGRHGHVTGDTTVLGAPDQAFRDRKTATAALMAAQALLAEESELLLRRGELVRVVTGNATKLPLGLSITTAGLHLLDVPDRLVLSPVRGVIDCVEGGGGKTGSIVERVTAGQLDPMIAQEVALLADGRAERGLEMPRIDDGQVKAIHHLLPCRMQLARTVASLAANRVASKDRILVQIDRELDWLDAVRMTEQALGLNGSLEMVVATLVAGRKVPLSLLAVPGDGRLEQPAVTLDQIRDTSGSRSQSIANLCLHLCQHPASLVVSRLTVKLPPIAPLDGEPG